MLNATLAKRYPQLLFLLNSQKPRDSHQGLTGPSDEIDRFVQKVRREEPQLIFLIGLNHLSYFLMIEKWLEEHPYTDLLVFEEDLELIASVLKHSEAQRIFQSPQIHLRYILQHASLTQALQEAVKEYPAEKICIEVTPSYKNKYCAEELSLMVLRRATITAALFNEDVYYHLLFRNLLKNFMRLPECFYADVLRGKFRGIPAVICGAGPSLNDHIPLLKEMGQKALIIAGGSTLAALSSQGVHPHIGLALDPNPEEYDRLKANQDFEIPLLFGARVAESIFRTCNGPLGYMRTFSGGLAEQALEEKMQLSEESLFSGVSQEGLSVTVMCVAAAIRFGCNPIFLSGIDLAYTGGKRYAEGVVQDAAINIDELHGNSKNCEKLLCKINRHGEEVHTMVKWIMEAQAIEDFAALNPETKVYDCMDKGLGFKTCEYLPLSKAIEQYCTEERDLKGSVYQCIAELPHFCNQQKEVYQFVQELQQSIERSHSVVEDFLQELSLYDPTQDPKESALLTLYTMDLEEEPAYQYLLEPMEQLMMPQLDKELRSVQNADDYQITLLSKKWSHFKKLLTHYQTLFASS